jgi:hypothetical protein
VTWNPTGIEEGENDSEYVLFGAEPNPAAGEAVVVFSLPFASTASITVYDMTGRMLRGVSSDFEAGLNEVAIDVMHSGVYLVRMISGGFAATQRFVVIE